MDLWLDFGHLVRDFVSTKISFQGSISDDNYQIQNVHNQQILLDELNEAHENQTVENSENIHQSGGDIDLENLNANLEETIDDQVVSSDNIHPNIETLINEANQNIRNEDDDEMQK